MRYEVRGSDYEGLLVISELVYIQSVIPSRNQVGSDHNDLRALPLPCLFHLVILITTFRSKIVISAPGGAKIVQLALKKIVAIRYEIRGMKYEDEDAAHCRTLNPFLELADPFSWVRKFLSSLP